MIQDTQLIVSEGAQEFGSTEFWLAALAIVVLCGMLLGFVDGRVRNVLEHREKETGKPVTWVTKAITYSVYFVVGAGMGAPLGVWMWGSILLGLICGAIGGAGGTWFARLAKDFIKRKFGGGS